MGEHHRSASGRKLNLRVRAERQEETRQRITEAAVQLHQEVGPLRTTVTAIADLAGVERLTVYRHFPDEGSLHAACQNHFFSVNPPPDPASWTLVNDFEERVRLDTEYIDRWSLWLDLKILVNTVPAVMRRTGAY